MKKIFLATVIFLATFGASFAQTASWNTFENADGFSLGLYFSDVDSTGTETSNWVDWSIIDNQTLRITYLLGEGTGAGTITNDSAIAIIQGRTPIRTSSGTITYSQTNIDTVLMIGNTIYTQSALSLSGYHPQVRITVTATGHASTPNNNNRTVGLSVYGTKRDHEALGHQTYGNIPK